MPTVVGAVGTVTRGLAPRRRKTQETQLDSNEIQELTRRGNTERDAYDAERVAGLGFAPYAPPPSSPSLERLAAIIIGGD